MKRAYQSVMIKITWFINGILFLIATILFYDNHISISAFEHQFCLWKDILFFVVVTEHILCLIDTYKYLSKILEPKPIKILPFVFVWLLGVGTMIMISAMK